ncbi:MAG: trypsin-like peptidase domain-containing protein [Planctomycetes bacterium]|nr:trypsin-like peptidase domain-containing protein [Planctomycetota bacterium]
MAKRFPVFVPAAVMAAALLAAIMAAGCSAARGPECAGGDAALARADLTADHPAGEAEGLDDRQLDERLRREGEVLLDAGKTVAMATLIKQLGRAECRLKLPAAPGKRLPAADLYARAKASVLVLGRLYVCPKCKKRHVTTATGFAISESGAVVTNYHVVNEPASLALVAMTADGRVLPVREVLAANKADDVAILQLDGGGVRPLALAPDAPVGAAVWVLSHPERRFYTLTEGIVSRYFGEQRGGTSAAVMSITADFARGSSGAPVLDERGAVVGVAASTTSLYYQTGADGRQENFQMAIKKCVPAARVLALISGR